MTHPPGTERLRWQSRLLVIVLTPVIAMIVAAFVARTRTAAALTALSISLAIALIAWLARAATPLAALTGGILTAAILLPRVQSGATGWLRSPLAPLVTLFLLTLAATKYRSQDKDKLGAGQEGRGRSAAQVVANLGVAGVAGSISLTGLLFDSAGGKIASLSSFLTKQDVAVIMVAALAEATADTLSSELGEVLGGEPLLITTWQPAAAGTDGAVSKTGTLAGAIGAALVVLAAIPTVGLGRFAAMAAATGATGGLFLDSLLGATLEQRGWLNNDAVNFLSTLAAALLAFAIIRFS